MRPAAQLVAVALDPDGANRLAVLLVEERVGAGSDGLLHRHEAGRDGSVVADDAPHLRLDRRQLVPLQSPIQGKVEPEVIRGHEGARLAGALADDIAQRPMEQMRPRVVAHRVGAPLGVDDGVDRLADPEPPVKGPAMDDQPAERPLGVVHGEQRRPATGLAELAAVADLAAALGVERRPIEHDLRLALAGQLVELDAVTDDRDDPALRLRALVAQELRVARPSVDRAVERGGLGLLGQFRLLAAPTPLPLLSKGRLEPLAIDPDPVFGGQLDCQVERETRTCRGA